LQHISQIIALTGAPLFNSLILGKPLNSALRNLVFKTRNITLSCDSKHISIH